jgi:selenocysteine lyase/cysteine desulfurase
VEAIHRHNLDLADALARGLDREPTGSAIVAIDLPDDLPADALAGIRASMRAGRLRVSFHLYNTMEDVERLIAAIRPRRR